MRATHQAGLVALALGMALTAGGCGSGAGDSTPPAGSASTTAVAPTDASTEEPTQPAPERPHLDLDDPGLVVQVPEGWTERSLTELRASIAADLMDSPPAVRRILREMIGQIDSGVIVGQLDGPSSDGGFTPSVVISVETGDPSLAAAATRRTRYLQDVDDVDLEWEVSLRDPISLPVGRSVRIIAYQDPPESHGVPSQSIEFVLFIDGRTVSFAGTAPTADGHFSGVMSDLSASLSRS
jgi:hypothetical protein